MPASRKAELGNEWVGRTNKEVELGRQMVEAHKRRATIEAWERDAGKNLRKGFTLRAFLTQPDVGVVPSVTVRICDTQKTLVDIVEEADVFPSEHLLAKVMLVAG
jgi:hypothetical protein